jgi:hypothetical protein
MSTGAAGRGRMGMIEPDDLQGRLDVLAALVPLLEAPDGDFGHWDPPWTAADGTMRLPQFVTGALCDTFRDAVARGHWVIVGFDWPTWARTDEAQALWRDPATLAAATPDQLAWFLTALIRSERFSEGTLDENYRSGVLARIARRAAVLAEELRANDDRTAGD